MMRLIFSILCLGYWMSVPAFADTTLGEAVEVEVVVKTRHMWNGQPLPPFTTGNPEISILRYVIPPGVRLPMHTHDYANAGILLSGSLTVRDAEGAVKRLQPGDALVELIGLPHYGVNEGDEAAVIVVFYAGEAGQPLSANVE